MEKYFIIKPVASLEKRGSKKAIIIGSKYKRGLKQLEHFSHIRFFWYRDSALNNKIGLSTGRIISP